MGFGGVGCALGTGGLGAGAALGGAGLGAGLLAVCALGGGVALWGGVALGLGAVIWTRGGVWTFGGVYGLLVGFGGVWLSAAAAPFFGSRTFGAESLSNVFCMSCLLLRIETSALLDLFLTPGETDPSVLSRRSETEPAITFSFLGGGALLLLAR